jgi:hypothetical protein
MWELISDLVHESKLISNCNIDIRSKYELDLIYILMKLFVKFVLSSHPMREAIFFHDT